VRNMGKKEIEILVVDDHGATRTLISVLLQRLGYDNISVARDGMEALEKLRTRKYDLILSDWDMPEIDGLSLWNKIREDSTLQGIPLIMVTAINEVEMVRKALSEGIADYMVKPITLQTLTTKIERALKKEQRQ
jgi:two-component system, chemotaxis family, chemotaxis protein CheY